LAFFAGVPFLFVGFFLSAPAAIIWKKGRKAHTWLVWGNWTLTVIFWIMFGIALCLATTFGDSCDMLTASEVDPTLYTNLTDQEAAVVKACVANTSITQALNMTDLLNSVAAIPSSTATLPDVDKMWTDSGFDTATINGANDAALDDWTSGEAESKHSQVLAKLNTNLAASPFNTNKCKNAAADAAYDKACTQANCELLDPAVWTADADKAKYWGVVARARFLNEVSGVVAQINKQKGDIHTLNSNHKAATKTARTNLLTVSTDMKTIATAAENLKTASSCGKIGSQYKQFKSTWCDTITVAFSLGALAYFLLIIGGYFLMVFGARAIMVFTDKHDPVMQADPAEGQHHHHHHHHTHHHHKHKQGAVAPYKDQDKYGDKPPAMQHQHHHEHGSHKAKK
jgi:energy-coupling factor transporter transmembrane protein EcfT